MKLTLVTDDSPISRRLNLGTIIPPSTQHAPSYSLLIGQIQASFQGDFRGASIYYTDSDGDKCVVLNDDDLTIALSEVEGPLLKLQVEQKKADKQPSSPPPPNPQPPSSPGKEIKEMVDTIASVVVDGFTNLKAAKADYCSKAGLYRKPPQFGHKWHTCDGCQQSPIFGSRFHCNEIPDYDLCLSCHRKASGNMGGALSFAEIRGEPISGRCGKGRRGWRRRSDSSPHHGKGLPPPPHQVPHPHFGNLPNQGVHHFRKGAVPSGPFGYCPPHTSGAVFSGVKRSCVPPPDPLSKLVEEAIRRSIRDQKKLLHRELSTGPSLKKRRSSKSDAARDAASAARSRQTARDAMTLVLQQVAAFHMNRDADLTTDAGNAPGSVPASGAPPALSAAVSTSAPTLVSSPSASAFAGAAGTSTVAPPAVVEDDGWDVLDPALCAQVSNDECIEILERLNAANLGSGEIGEVKVEKVVEVLLSEW
ncbi:hypothetical protein TrRE_jg9746 [Triparma retinervis]|uniref:ZZ-type domain-containing protein n=1 Tax=Triparma retinervis TaxID=2557542 RepID=A0A9W7DR96_9STRA|nr:hypothetical protein TrRE_jg9746 [Triparma retinervis]